MLLTRSLEDKGFHAFPKGICPKVNETALLEFEPAYYDFAVQRFNHYSTEWSKSRHFYILSDFSNLRFLSLTLSISFFLFLSLSLSLYIYIYMYDLFLKRDRVYNPGIEYIYESHKKRTREQFPRQSSAIISKNDVIFFCHFYSQTLSKIEHSRD